MSRALNSALDFLSEVARTLTKKNRLYGDSVGSPVSVFSTAPADTLVKARIDDKLSRIRGHKADDDEGMVELLIDLCGYIAFLGGMYNDNRLDSTAEQPQQEDAFGDNSRSMPYSSGSSAPSQTWGAPRA